MLLHASTISLAGHGVLFVGPSGSGKSQLAHRLIRYGAWLVADDQTLLTNRQARIWAACPPGIAGQMEVRGIGIVAAPHQAEAAVDLVLDLDPAAWKDPAQHRMPEFQRWATPADIENSRPIPCVPFDACRPDAAEAVIAALAQSRNWEDSPAL